jgi:hypothetical protein
MDTYTKYFNIINGLNEKVMIEPKGNNRLYLIGKLSDMPQGITALLFYGYDGSIFQFTKLVTFDETGLPITEQNMQYYINGSNDGVKEEEKMTCKLNADKSVSCLTYTMNAGEEEMTAKSGVIYEVQPDGTIKEVGAVDMEAAREEENKDK